MPGINDTQMVAGVSQPVVCPACQRHSTSKAPSQAAGGVCVCGGGGGGGTSQCPSRGTHRAHLLHWREGEGAALGHKGLLHQALRLDALQRLLSGCGHSIHSGHGTRWVLGLGGATVGGRAFRGGSGSPTATPWRALRTCCAPALGAARQPPDQVLVLLNLLLLLLEGGPLQRLTLCLLAHVAAVVSGVGGGLQGGHPGCRAGRFCMCVCGGAVAGVNGGWPAGTQGVLHRVRPAQCARAHSHTGNWWAGAGPLAL